MSLMELFGGQWVKLPKRDPKDVEKKMKLVTLLKFSDHYLDQVAAFKVQQMLNSSKWDPSKTYGLA